MKVNQIATLLNTIINKEQIGGTAVVNEDLSNIVDIGETVINYLDESKTHYDAFIRELIDQVGKIVFDDRPYKSKAPNIVKMGWEYGAILEKVRCELPDARNNASWELDKYPIANGAAYPDPFELSKPNVKAKFFSEKNTFEIPITFTEYQLKSAFRTAAEMGSFIAMIENRIRMKQTLSTDAMIQRAINTLIGLKINNGNNVVNLLAEFNGLTGTLTAAEALSGRNVDFNRFAAMTMMLYKEYIQSASTLYNDGGYVTFTPEDRLKFVLLTPFAKALEVYLYSTTFNDEFVKLDGYTEVSYWQGSGTTGGDRDKIDISLTIDGESTEISQSGIVGVMFDEWAAVVCNENYRVTTQYNARGEYFNNFYKWDANLIADNEENCIVFIIADVKENKA